jgi:hypothetical protein
MVLFVIPTFAASSSEVYDESSMGKEITFFFANIPSILPLLDQWPRKNHPV